MKNKILLVLSLILLFTPISGQGGCQTCQGPSFNPGKISQEKIIEVIKNEESREGELVWGETKPQTFSGSILLPLFGDYSTEEKITFWAFALGGKPPYKYRWFSSRNGFLSKNKNFSTILSLGNHTIVLETTDATGSISQDNLFLMIKKFPLKVEIILPQKSQVYKAGDVINLNYSAAGGEKPYQLNWTLDGKEISGVNLRVPPYTPRHSTQIKLEIKDAQGGTASDLVEIFVKGPCNGNGICDESENFQNCPQECQSGGKDNYCDRVFDKICDPDCQVGQDRDCLCNQDGFCEIGSENYGNCPEDCQSGSRDGYCDKVEDEVCDPDCSEGDSDCEKNYFEYGMLLILIFFIILAYLKLKKFITAK